MVVGRGGIAGHRSLRPKETIVPRRPVRVGLTPAARRGGPATAPAGAAPARRPRSGSATGPRRVASMPMRSAIMPDEWHAETTAAPREAHHQRRHRRRADRRQRLAERHVHGQRGLQEKPADRHENDEWPARRQRRGEEERHGEHEREGDDPAFAVTVGGRTAEEPANAARKQIRRHRAARVDASDLPCRVSITGMNVAKAIDVNVRSTTMKYSSASGRAYGRSAANPRLSVRGNSTCGTPREQHRDRPPAPESPATASTPGRSAARTARTAAAPARTRATRR